MLNKTLAAACISAAFIWTPVPSFAAVSVWVHRAPPELRVEQAPAPRRGYHWVPGYWDWNGRRHVWKTGTWVRERHGYAYASPTWVEDHGKWRLQRGQWSKHDEDRDGIPNAVDRDRDGDGVRNSKDRHPDNPARR
ncbi:MAG: hypothetical protein ABI605_19515 [Rhizobacter sp.]